MSDEIQPLAVRTRTAGQFDAGRIVVTYSYRDTDGRVLTIECTNTSPTYNMTVRLLHPTTRAVYWSATQPKGAGTKTWQEPDFPQSSLTQRANPKPPGALIWAANNTIELALS